MKSIIICPFCQKPKKASESYRLKVWDYRDSSRLVKEDESGNSSYANPMLRKVSACRNCIKKMGYKVKVVKNVSVQQVQKTDK